ncbi:HalOD1 output domain-containing protein [Halomicroarcula sp. GCM10025817]|uniref:HalOD1 output domain-containing protein n=1 Tax=Haloarcula TaxID=2237 RepID=UPI0023E85F6C|nr:HalOD1 output domain-containing protein [Halomicroarcula sp. SYNS111]
MQYSKPSPRCDCTPVVGTRFGGDAGRSPAEAVVEAVAAAEGVASLELPSLYDEIDLESVDRLFSETTPPSTRPTLLQFSVLGWKVYLRSDGALRVCDPTQSTDTGPVFEKAICD